MSRPLTRTLALGAVLLGVLESPVGAQGSAVRPVDSLRVQEEGQERLGVATGESAALLAEVLEDFARNGLEGSDVEVLGGIRTVLGTVAGELMPAIVEDLAAARRGADEGGKRARAMAAYAGQKSAAYQMRQALLAYQRQIVLYQLAARVQELGDRQSANLHETVALVMALQKPSATRRAADFAISRQLQETEQESLREEVGLVIRSLEELRADFEGSLENRPAEALAFVAAHDPVAAMRAAQDELKGERLMSAASYEKSARDTLWRLAVMLQPERDPLDRLVAGLEKLDGLIAEERELVVDTQDLDNPGRATVEEQVGSDPVVRQLEEQLGVMQQRLEQAGPEEQIRLADSIERDRKRLREEIAKVRERRGVTAPEMSEEQRGERLQRDQAEVVDRTDFLRQELRELATEAAERLAESISPMQEARMVLGSERSAGEKVAAAVPPEEAALAKLGEAREALLAEIAQAQFGEELPSDRLALLRKLLEQVRHVEEEERKLQAAGAEAEMAGDHAALKGAQAGAQEALRRHAETVERAAQSPAPEAARLIGEAAGQMTAAQESLAEGRNAPLAQQAAIDALQQAAEKLEGQIAALERAQEDLAALQAQRAKLDEVIAEQWRVQRDTIDEVARPEEGSSRELAARQEALESQTAVLGQEVQGPAPEAGPDLGEAREAMAAAEASLAQTRPLAAQPQQGEALADLQRARGTLNEKIAALQQELGLAIAEGQADLAEALAVIDEAQGQLSEALSRLAAPGGAPPAAGPLQAANAAVNPLASGAQGSLPLGAESILQAAQGALANAAAQANAGSPTTSQGEAQAAQNALAQAAAALSLAQAGLSPGPGEGAGPAEDQAAGEGEGEGEGPGQGQGQGEGEGQGQGQGEGQGQGQGQGRGQKRKGNGNEGNWNGPGGEGPRRQRDGVSKHIGLPERERGTLRQSHGDAYSPEDGRMIEQYLKNLSDASSGE